MSLRRAYRLLILASSVLAAHGALAQPAPMARSGGEDGERPPGAYASPSGIPEAPLDEKFGIPQFGGHRSLDPIELPARPPEPGSASLALPALPTLKPQMLPALEALRPENALILTAKLEESGDVVPDGLVWRLFSPTPTPEGRLQLVALQKGGEAVFDVPAGSYLMHVGYGRAGLTRRIDFSGEQTRETVILKAGGLRLGATAAEGVPVSSPQLTFDLLAEAGEGEESRLIAEDVPANVVVRLNAGTYEIVSNYGAANAIVRAEARVEAGRITDVTVKHHAAELTMKLVREEGGEALADTAWSIASSQGDIIKENVGAFSSVVLAEGDYVVVAKNRERIYQRQLTVVAGQNAEVEILNTDLEADLTAATGSGD